MASHAQPLLTICIPTNGVIEWVVPVIESIYRQKIDESLFEVVVADNGGNPAFAEKMAPFASNHVNFVYRQTNSQSFLNQIDAFSMAKGRLIKFLNHRYTLREGALQHLIDFVQSHDESCCVYFSEGKLSLKGQIKTTNSFDAYVETLSYWSSFSGGLAMWREDFKALDKGMKFDKTYPHVNLLFSRPDKSMYVIDDTPLSEEPPTDHSKKGRYNLFEAFAVIYPSLLLDLVKANFIKIETWHSVKKKLLGFLGSLYLDFVILKRPCSYSLENRNHYLGVFYSVGKVRRAMIKCAVKRVFAKVLRKK